ncbi:GLPGLI family protein, partial [candidate division KSB1 bacterium]
NFLVSESIEKFSWKMTNKRSKVLNYNCMGAELKKGENTITAWFTPEIPLPAGPDEYSGLPGLVLAVEVNGEFTYIATEVNLTPPNKDTLSKPDKGRNIDRKEFDKIVDEKIKEFLKNRGKRIKK